MKARSEGTREKSESFLNELFLRPVLLRKVTPADGNVMFDSNNKITWLLDPPRDTMLLWINSTFEKSKKIVDSSRTLWRSIFLLARNSARRSFRARHAPLGFNICPSGPINEKKRIQRPTYRYFMDVKFVHARIPRVIFCPFSFFPPPTLNGCLNHYEIHTGNWQCKFHLTIQSNSLFISISNLDFSTLFPKNSNELFIFSIYLWWPPRSRQFRS